ncbi:MAG: PP2C family protein-serine/threonine phosphatase [Ruminococcus sp.]|nr:PP2C family protein-serine/threonine phosphatase [Ruminococcus sp.]
MTQQEIIDGLYRILLIVALILLGILLVNNLFLYKQKIKDRLSLMLVTAVSMSCFEILWTFCNRHSDLRALTYIGACGYTITFVLLTAFLNSYILSRFDRYPKSRLALTLLYVVPTGIFALLSITTPFTHLLVKVDENGVLSEEVLLDAVFIPLMLLYVMIAFVVSIEYAVRSRRKKRTAAIRIAHSMIVFTLLIPAVYIIEASFLGIDSNYLALSLAVSVSMVYLTTNVSTHTLLETSAKVAATESELNFATEIQASMLPSVFPAFPDRTEFDIHASMDPAKEVGGDFYDFFMIDDDHLAMVIADVSGKGVPAALFMMSSKILINDHATIGGTPAEILERVNKQVYANNKANMFVTVWLGILEISTGKLISASAGHEYPMINVNGQYELLKDKHGLAVGAMGKTKYKNTEIQLKKGDSIFVYTDGVAEATDAENQLFGTERTVDALNAIPAGASQKELLEGVRAALDAFVKEAPQFDDLTMLGLKYYGPADTSETGREE